MALDAVLEHEANELMIVCWSTEVGRTLRSRVQLQLHRPRDLVGQGVRLWRWPDLRRITAAPRVVDHSWITHFRNWTVTGGQKGTQGRRHL